MRIKRKSTSSPLKSLSKKFILLLFLAAFLIYSLGIFLVSVWAVQRNYHYTIAEAVKSNVRIPINYLKSLTVNPDRLQIDIKFKHLEKLQLQNQEARRNNGFLLTWNSDTTYVPLKITYEGETYKAEARLKGNFWDSRISDKLSLRIKMKGDNTIRGMETFSLHSPIAKGYLTEWLFQKLVAREDVISMQYDYIEVSINGKKGIYAIEESFEKYVLERNRYHESIIVKFDEYWLYRSVMKDMDVISYDEFREIYSLSPIRAYKMNSIQSDSTLFQRFKDAKNMIEAFRLGEVPAHKVFDVERMAKLFAICDLMGYPHNVELRNMRFYFNPFTYRLEPIGYDQHVPVRKLVKLIGEGRSLYNPKGNQIWENTFFQDSIFYRYYMETIQRISKPAYLDGFYEEVGSEFRRKLKIVYKDSPHIRNNYFQLMRTNQEYIRKKLNPVKMFDAYSFMDQDSLRLQVSNVHLLPIRLVKLTYKDQLVKDFTGQNILVDAKVPFKPLINTELSLYLPPGSTISNDSLVLECQLVGTDYAKREYVRSWKFFDDEILDSKLKSDYTVAAQLDWIIRNEEAQTYEIISGEHVIDQDVIIPPGYRLQGKGPLTLDLIKGASLVSNSPVELVGTEINPIYIHSSDSTGQGLVVIQAEQESYLKYVNFNNLMNPSKGGWKLTGAVTFFESDVIVDYCSFSNNRSEDGLHIVRSDFIIEHSLFENTTSDAFDADFTEGKISMTRFFRSGNDAIDISGSAVEASDITMIGIGDKGLSGGENSQLSVDRIYIENGEIAVASKDLSEVKINDIEIENCTVGYTVFQKKSEFGPGTVEVTKMTMNNVDVPYLVEATSSMKVDGKVIITKDKKVKEMLYGVKYGKESVR